MLNQHPIKRRKISEEVADRIEQMIRDEGLEVGDALPSEREIMVAFGVGAYSATKAAPRVVRRPSQGSAPAASAASHPAGG